jgi:hypothetical protein
VTTLIIYKDYKEDDSLQPNSKLFAGFGQRIDMFIDKKVVLSEKKNIRLSAGRLESQFVSTISIRTIEPI